MKMTPSDEQRFYELYELTIQRWIPAHVYKWLMAALSEVRAEGRASGFKAVLMILSEYSDEFGEVTEGRGIMERIRALQEQSK